MKAYFFPGVGADESLAGFHELPGMDIEWVRWPRRIANDWPEFVRFLLEDNSIEDGSVFIGISFGGMAAQMLAPLKKPSAIILIGSCRSSRSISPLLLLFKPLVKHLPEALFKISLLPRWLGSLYFGLRDKGHVDLLFEMGRRLSPLHFKKINNLALHFEAPRNLEIPVFSIHGEADRIILAGREKRDLLLRKGGHLISMTHSKELNEAILEWLDRISSGQKAATP